jgi:hypothetical protein
MTTQVESPMQKIERAERAALRHDREDPTERRDREQAERDAIVEAQQAERDALAEAEREAAAAALITEEAAAARALQQADDDADELRIQRVLALVSIINEAESRLTPQIEKAQQALDQSIADGTDEGALSAAWTALRVASAELWTITAVARNKIALAKGEPEWPPSPGPLDALTWQVVLDQALAARAEPAIAAARAAINAAYSNPGASKVRQ